MPSSTVDPAPGPPAAPRPSDQAAARAGFIARLERALARRATPTLIGPGFSAAGSTIWADSNAWTLRFREADLHAGDRLVLAATPTPGFLAALVAAVRHGLAVRLISADADAAAEREMVSARLAISPRPGRGVVCPPGSGPPPGLTDAVGPASDPTSDVALLMSTSGSTGRPRIAALSWTNIEAQLESHLRPLDIAATDTIASVLPWHHAFGLLVDLLPSVLSGATVVSAHHAAKRPTVIVALAEAARVTGLSMVPITAEDLLATPGGGGLLRRLRRGVIGGAPVSARLASALRRTRLQAGYGLTECAPGVTLGDPGDWRSGWLGSPINGEVSIGPGGELRVRGPNVCLGFWGSGGLERAAPGRWLATGDLAERRGEGFVFLGRRDARFKLANGRMVDAPALERALREHLPADCEPVVFSADGRTVDVAVIAGFADCRPLVEACLGPLAGRLGAVRCVDRGTVPRTRKGEIDRAALRLAVDAGPTRPAPAAVAAA